MKKKAYTLAEALVAMGIIGVIAAIMLPMANKFKPDTAKVMYLKNYDAIVEAIGYFAGSSTLYPTYNTESTGSYQYLIYDNYPLYNTIAVDDNEIGVKLNSGARKFCETLAFSFGIDSANAACNQTNINGTTPSFTTKSGCDYIVKTTIKPPAGNIGYFKSEILLDVDGLSEGKNCLYNATSCPNPDKFEFVVYSGGQLYAKDKKGREYLTTRSSWRKTDELVASTYAGENTALETFNLVKHDPGEFYEPTPDDEGTPGDSGSLSDLPAGHKWAPWVDVAKIRTTSANGVYCECHNPSMPAGNYSHQRHVYWHQEAQAWVELEGVYFVSSGEYNFPKYNGADASKITQW